MRETIFIPKKIKVGFNERSDTYTKKLGYVIYHDGKIWRKEPSWDSWRVHVLNTQEYETKKQDSYDAVIRQQTQYYKSYVDQAKREPTNSYYSQYANMTEEDYLKKMVGSYAKYKPYIGNVTGDKSFNPVEYDNEPLDGFVLNKNAGGTSSGWDHRQSYCRVYDPRGFEFEITIPNLLYILENANSIKGKGLDGKFIYGWDGKDLVLVPEGAPEYKRMIEYTANLGLKVAKKDLKIGGVYSNSHNDKVVYLCTASAYDYDGVKYGGKHLWFYDLNSKSCTTLSISSIKKYIEDVDNLSDLLDNLEKNKSYKPKHPSVYKYEPCLTYSNNNNFIAGKKKNTWQSVYIYEKYDYSWQSFKKVVSYQISGRGIPYNTSFKTFAELIIEYPIYKQTKVNEKI